jgi:outer membrane protein assembly factor BamB
VSAYTYETPLVYSNGLLFAMDAINADRIYAFDASNGEMVKHYTFPADHYGFYYHAPAVSGDKLYFMTLDGSLVCYSISGENLLWHYPLITIEGRKPPKADRNAHMRFNRNEGFQFVTSPVIANDWIYAAAGNTLFALDLNGRVQWQLPTTGSLYDAPAILSEAGKLYRCGMSGVAE